jgi:hypothetical protein
VLIILYNLEWNNNIKKIELESLEIYKEEWALIRKMKAPKYIRPANINQLKHSQEYLDWIASLPTYIPKYFAT